MIWLNVVYGFAAVCVVGVVLWVCWEDSDGGSRWQ